MIGWMRERLDRMVAASIIVGCLSCLVWGLVPGDELGARPSAVRDATGDVDLALATDTPVEPHVPDYHGAFAARMARSGKALPAELVAWKFSPQPPALVSLTPPPPPNAVVDLRQPTIEPGSVAIGRCTLMARFSDKDMLWRTRALQVWRKAPGAAEWPEHPLVTIKASADGPVELPPNVTLSGNGYELAINDQKPRERWEYRARTTAVFPEKFQGTVNGRHVELAVKLPDDPPEREDLLEDAQAATKLRALLAGDPPVFALLEGRPFVTRFSAPVAVEFPGDTQISYEAPVTVDGKDSANFRIRHYRPEATGADQDGWCARLERFSPGDDLQIAGWRMIVKDATTGKERREKADVDSGFRLVRLFGRARPGLAAERLAVIQDKATRKEIELVARADGGGWWPRDMPLTPKAEEPQPARSAPRTMAAGEPAIPTAPATAVR